MSDPALKADQTQEQTAGDVANQALGDAGGVVQFNRKMDFGGDPRLTVRNLQTVADTAAQAQFVGQKPAKSH